MHLSFFIIEINRNKKVQFCVHVNDYYSLICKFRDGIMSTKSYMYSFGVVLFELIFAKEVVLMNSESNAEPLNY